MSAKLLALFNLKTGADKAKYLEWAKSVDLPTVNGLKSVDNFQVFSIQGLLGSDEKAPYEYYEFIDINQMDEFLGEVSTDAMQKVAAQFQTFTDDVIFMLSDEVK